MFASARKAELEAEDAIRKYAEFVPCPPYNGQECDERIGKWCVYYEPAGKSLPKEPKQVGEARDRAIVELQKAFDVAPARPAIVYPLVRLPCGLARVAARVRRQQHDAGEAGLDTGAGAAPE